MSGTSVRSVLFVILAALTFSMCAKTDSGPTGPTTTQPPAQTTPAPAPTPTPSVTANVSATVTPNPVTQSGTPITDAAGCANVKYTWFYDQKLTESGGAAVTFTGRVDSFDGRDVNNLANLNMTVNAMGNMAVKTRWCSSTAAEHSAQTRWSGVDANGHQITVSGPLVRLLKP